MSTQEWEKKGRLICPCVQWLLDPGWPRTHAREKASEFSGCWPWASGTLSSIIPNRAFQGSLANGQTAGPGHFCTVCKHFCICGRATKDKSISRSLLLLSVGEDIRIPANARHSAAALHGKRSSVFWAELGAFMRLSYSHNHPLRTNGAVGLTMEFVIIAAIKCEGVGSCPVSMTDNVQFNLSCFHAKWKPIGWIYSTFIMHLHNPPMDLAVYHRARAIYMKKIANSCSTLCLPWALEAYLRPVPSCDCLAINTGIKNGPRFISTPSLWRFRYRDNVQRTSPINNRWHVALIGLLHHPPVTLLPRRKRTSLRP